jgi:hypothetical protein
MEWNVNKQERKGGGQFAKIVKTLLLSAASTQNFHNVFVWKEEVSVNLQQKYTKKDKHRKKKYSISTESEVFRSRKGFYIKFRHEYVARWIKIKLVQHETSLLLKKIWKSAHN